MKLSTLVIIYITFGKVSVPHTFQVHLEDKKEDLYDSLKFLLRDLITKDMLGVKLSRILPPSDYDYAELLLVCASRDKQVQNNILSGPRVGT